MDILAGRLYFISDVFFTKVNDPHLKIDYKDTKRPHYFTIQDSTTGLYWLVPCSSRVEKFETIVNRRKESGKPTDGIKIVTIQNSKTVLLFQDMFPIVPQYIEAVYTRGRQVVRIADPKVIQELEKNARKVVSLLRHGVRFTPTQPDILKIEARMLAELEAFEAIE